MKSANYTSAATTNATLISAKPAAVGSILAYNAGAALAYIKFYNKASAPTVGTDLPVFVVALPATSSVSIPLQFPYRFSLGLGFAMTNVAADTDTTAVALNQLKLAIVYENT